MDYAARAGLSFTAAIVTLSNMDAQMDACM